MSAGAFEVHVICFVASVFPNFCLQTITENNNMGISVVLGQDTETRLLLVTLQGPVCERVCVNGQLDSKALKM